MSGYLVADVLPADDTYIEVSLRADGEVDSNIRCDACGNANYRSPQPLDEQTHPRAAAAQSGRQRADYATRVILEDHYPEGEPEP